MYCKEIRPYWLLVTKGYGFSVRDIDLSCPADLQPYADAYNLAQKEKDTQMWAWWGNYGLCSITMAIEKCLAGDKAKMKYIKSPIMGSINTSENKENKEEIACYEMKQRTQMLMQSGLPESPE